MTAYDKIAAARAGREPKSERRPQYADVPGYLYPQLVAAETALLERLGLDTDDVTVDTFFAWVAPALPADPAAVPTALTEYVAHENEIGS